jgi:hypothetical protein
MFGNFGKFGNSFGKMGGQSGGNPTSLAITAPSFYSYLTSASPYDFGGTITLADTEDAGGTYTFSWEFTTTVVTLPSLTGLTGSGNGTTTGSYSGTLAAWNAVLAAAGNEFSVLSDASDTSTLTLTRDADSLEISRNVTVNAYPALGFSSTSPADGATGVAYNTSEFTWTFDRSVALGTGNLDLRVIGGASVETFDVTSDVSVDGDTISFTATGNLPDATDLEVVAPSGAIYGSEIGVSDSFALAAGAGEPNWTFSVENTTPTLSAPLDSETGGTTATAAVTTDRGDGTLWWVVTTSATTPSHAQIKAGQDHTGSAAAADGSQAVTATGSQGVSITGLTAETQYYTHFTQESVNDAAATPVSADGFLTPDITEPVLNSSVPADNATGVAVDSTIVLTFDENVILTTGGGNITLRKLDGSWTVVETFSRSTDTTGTGDNGGSISISGAVVTITPGADMAETTTHALQVAADCLENEAGHAYAGITDDTTLNWQTGIADTYAVEGFSPPVVADFAGELNGGTEYYRVGGSATTFDDMFTYTSGDALSTMTDSDGLLKWCPHNAQVYSENTYGSPNNINTGWQRTNCTIDSTPITAPDGTTTAYKIVENSDTGQIHYIVQNSSALDGSNTVGVGLYAKAAGRTFLKFKRGFAGIHNVGAYVNLTTGATANYTTTSGSVISVSATSIGDDWWYIYLTGSSDDTQYIYFELADSISNVTYNGDGSSGVYIWGIHSHKSSLGGMVNVPTDARAAAGAAFATYVPTTTAAKYLARRGNHVYNGTSWVNKGILLEPEARTNLLTVSNDLTDAAWIIYNTDSLTVTGSSSSGPDGNTSLAKLEITDTTNEEHGLSADASFTSGTNYVLSWVVKYDSSQRYVGLRIFGNPNVFVHATYDLTDGSVTQVSTGSSSGTHVTSGVVYLGNNTYRVYLVGSLGTVSVQRQGILFHSTGTPTLNSSAAESYAGTAGTYCYAGFVQFEAGSTPSSIIPTSGATVTRPAQALSIAGADFATDANSGSVYVGAYAFDPSIDTNATIITVAGSGDDWNVGSYAANKMNINISGTIATPSNNLTNQTSFKFMGKYDSSGPSCAACLDGGTVATATPPAFSLVAHDVEIGAGGIGQFPNITQIRYWPGVLISDAGMQSETT